MNTQPNQTISLSTATADSANLPDNFSKTNLSTSNLSTSNRLQTLMAIAQRWDLNAHAFYQLWNAGALTRDELSTYAQGYRGFMHVVPALWNTLDESTTAKYEAEHAVMWDAFSDVSAAAAKTPARPVPQMAAMTAWGLAISQQSSEALGALFAFEQQQERTAPTKLAGIDTHYPMSDDGKAYFVAHAGGADHGEIQLLASKLDAMSEHEFARTKLACEVSSAMLWNSLDGVLAAHNRVAC